MKIQFDDPLFEAWTQRPMLNIPEGGAEIGEIKATAFHGSVKRVAYLRRIG
jgi:hypothetical protein